MNGPHKSSPHGKNFWNRRFNIGSGVGQAVGDALKTLSKSAACNASIVAVEERKRPNDRPYLCPKVDRLKSTLSDAAKSFNLETAKSICSEPAHGILIFS